ncbi:16S rRNA (adenine(1518)-N(6)/adenine(1519)-N(6))-dimethyltransferase RsmA [Erysipelotrichaceae bacterium OttesenSCG-928-M19]|nr:16S rRNA (adenine(1518)-N(6)/adenine(1519)-N(6))-dimethyltransferase RsmA [Erysipelotrichaceae bacterium OttesenSCG-928-M19]
MNKKKINNKTIALLNEYELQAKKSYGQNFLIDQNTINNIITKANVHKKLNVIEIGPGLGSLTIELAKKANKVVCIEIDTKLKAALENNLQDYDNVTVIYDDFLKIDLEKLIKDNFNKDEEIIVVANLPYYITTPILIKIFESKRNLKITRICAMMQKEVGLRLSANKDTKDYNSLTILTQYYCDAKLVLSVSKNVFIPKPNVDSVVVLFTFKEQLVKPINELLFFKLLRILFAQRRKTILNNLKQLIKDKDTIEKILNLANLDPKLRAENLSLEDIILLSDIINKEGYDD